MNCIDCSGVMLPCSNTASAAQFFLKLLEKGLQTSRAFGVLDSYATPISAVGSLLYILCKNSIVIEFYLYLLSLTFALLRFHLKPRFYWSCIRLFSLRYKFSIFLRVQRPRQYFFVRDPCVLPPLSFSPILRLFLSTKLHFLFILRV